ncbi:MAG: L-2-hydroxyglutarate oxidase [Solirubrobacteraceae bacterium]
MRFVVVGGGILGLASARLLTRERPDADVVVLEKESDLAVHQTGRNSGVVHAGLYYAPGSLKARLCRRGAGLIRELCAEHGTAYEECGKVLVATREDELPRLLEIRRRAIANGVPGIGMLDAPGLRRIEPHTTGIAALHSPTTAIVDFAAVAGAMATDIVGAGGTIRTGVTVARITPDGHRSRVILDDGTTLTADRVIVCAGLHADRLARASGRPAAPRIIPFRGEYWALRPERTSLVRGLIYPVPDPTLPFLGVHLTRKIDGSVVVGPNAVLATAREGYRRRTVDRRDLGDTVRWPGTWRLARRHRRAAIAEIARSVSRRTFVHDARRFVPELRARDVVPARAGVRAQAVDADGTLVDDFRLEGDGRIVWVRNAPSPAATSSMAIAEELVARLDR